MLEGIETVCLNFKDEEQFIPSDENPYPIQSTGKYANKKHIILYQGLKKKKKRNTKQVRQSQKNHQKTHVRVATKVPTSEY